MLLKILFRYLIILLLKSQPILCLNNFDCQFKNTLAYCETTILAEINLDTIGINITYLDLMCTNKQPHQFPSAKFSRLHLLHEIYIDKCNLSGFETDALPGLQELHKLVITGIGNDKTKLNIGKEFFDSTPNLQTINMTDMGIYQLPNGIFCQLNKLLDLDLSRNCLEDLQGFECGDSYSNLEWLRLKYNRLKKAEYKQLLLPELKQLDLSHNQLGVLEDDCFNHLQNLQYIDLSNNKLTKIGNLNVNSQLLTIDLSFNRLTYLSPNAFPISVEYLALNDNQLLFNDSHQSIFNRMEILSYLDLSTNRIDYLPSGMFHNLPYLSYLNLSHNLLKATNNEDKTSNQNALKGLDLSHNQFTTVPNLKLFSCNVERLHLRGNKIIKLDFANLEYLRELEYLDLASNNISTTSGYSKNENMKSLELQNNEMTTFNLGCIPPELKSLNLSNNRVVFLTNRGYNVLTLQYFYASNNQLQDISILLDFSHITGNNILNLPVLRPLTSLQFLDLRNNSISKIWYADVRNKYPTGLPHLTIDVRNNPITCTCENDWLLPGNSVVPERLSIQIDSHCQVLYPRRGKVISQLDLRTATKSDMLCEDRREILCQTQCRCFTNADDPTKRYVVDCFNSSWNRNMVSSLPMQPATTIYFDANSHLESVIADLLVDADSLTTLYMNKSELATINKEMFRGTPNILELHLEDNQLQEITGNEFELTRKLEKLFLHDNSLHFIANDALNNLRLTTLTLHRNQLIQPPLWIMLHHVTQIRLTVSGNPLNCDCDFVVPIQQWMTKNQEIEFQDINETFCDNTAATILDFDTLMCFEANTLPIVVPSISISMFFIILTIITYLYRTEMLVWLYSRYGVRLFYSNNSADNGKVYDAFISYANEDDQWVAEDLVPQLNEYMLCLHQRDFVVGAYIPDSIVAAVENSCRTIIVLTPNFLRSHWCRFEFDAAHTQSLVDRCKRLVIVILQDIDKDDNQYANSELHAYLKTNTYLHINDSRFWSKLKYALPDLNRDKAQEEIALTGLLSIERNG